MRTLLALLLLVASLPLALVFVLIRGAWRLAENILDGLAQ